MGSGSQASTAARLAEACDRCTEGFTTPVFRNARALLDDRGVTDDDRTAFGDHIVQIFVRTSLFGALTSASTIELDYAFPPFHDRVPTFG